MDAVIEISLHTIKFDLLNLTAESILNIMFWCGVFTVLLFGNFRKERA